MEIPPFLGFDRGRSWRTSASSSVAECLIAMEVWQEVSSEKARHHNTVVAEGLVAHPHTATTNGITDPQAPRYSLHQIVVIPTGLSNILTLCLFVKYQFFFQAAYA